MNRDNEYVQIDLAKIVNGLIRRIWIVLVAMVLCGALLFAYSAFFVTPLYESSVLMYVNNSSFSVGATSFSISSSEISAAKSLVETYQVILKTRMTLDDVIKLGELTYSYEELCDMIETESVNDTEVFSVTVTGPDPYEAEHIANIIARVLPDKIAGIVEGSSVYVVDYAVVPSKSVSPNISKYTLLGMLLGLVVSCAIIIVIEMSDDRIKSEDYLLDNFSNIPLLAVVPDILDDKQRGQYYYYAKPSPETNKKSAKGRNKK